MRNVKSLTTLAVAAVLLAGTSAPGFADDGSQGFTFHLDDLIVGLVEVDTDSNSAKLEEYRDFSDGFQIPRLHISGATDDYNRSLQLRVSRFGREDARYTFDYAHAGHYALTIDYNKIPHNFGYGGKTLYARTGPGRYVIPDATQGFLQNAVENASSIDFDFLDGLVGPLLADAAPIDIGLRRDRAHADFALRDMQGMDWEVAVDRENRVGTRAIGTAFGFNNVTELPEPIDYDTTRAEFKGEWNGEQAGMVFGYRYEMFENQIDTLVWDNPWRLVDSTSGNAYLAPSGSTQAGSSTGLFDLAPDSDAGTLFVSGRARFGGNWLASGTLSLIRMEQNDSLKPFTTNTAIVGIDPHTEETFPATSLSSLPASKADAAADVVSFYGTLGGRFAERWTLKFRARYYDYQNDSAHIEFPGYVRFDAVWEEIPRQTVKYGYTVTDLVGEVGFDLTDNSRLGLSYTSRSWDRDFREIHTSDEDIIKLSWDADWGVFDLRASYETGDRTIGRYETEAQEFTFVEPEGINNQPELRKYDEAAREFDGWKVMATWMASDRVDLSFGLSGRNEDYPDSVFGLVKDDVMSYNAELSWMVSDSSNFYLFYQYQDREVFQRARQSGGTLSTDPAADWEVTFDEQNDLWGLGFNWKGSSPWDFTANVSQSKSDGGASFFSPPGGTPDGAEGFNDYEDIDLLSATARIGYEINDSLSTGVYWHYEDYTYDSFIVRFLDNYLPGALLINGNNGDYDVNVLAVYFRLKI